MKWYCCQSEQWRACAQDGFWFGRIFRGYNVVTLLVVANMAFSGLLVSWVMKFADSIMKVRSLRRNNRQVRLLQLCQQWTCDGH